MDGRMDGQRGEVLQLDYHSRNVERGWFLSGIAKKRNQLDFAKLIFKAKSTTILHQGL